MLLEYQLRPACKCMWASLQSPTLSPKNVGHILQNVFLHLHFKQNVIAFWIMVTGSIQPRKCDNVKLHKSHRKEVSVDDGLHDVLNLSPEVGVHILIPTSC